MRGSTTGRMNTAQMRYAIGRGIAAIRGQSPIDTSYIRYALIDGLPALLALTSGSVFPNISAGDLKGFELPWPSAEQRASIVDVLGAIDARIESNRRVIQISEEMLDALSAIVSPELPSTALGTLVHVARESINPARLGNELVDHYSLPAFDNGARPEHVAASSIMSGKLLISRRSILLSRLNPKTNRTWWVSPRGGTRAVASTEFSCLVSEDDQTLAAVWLAVRDEFFRTELTRRVTGTSGSHQRVRPDDVLSIEVPDIRTLDVDQKTTVLSALETVEQKREEIDRLAAFRDTLAPELLSGRLRATDWTEAIA
ncbi:restriction endonuclease subunit S [Rhodococcus rhodochrous]|uniref:restriction endonuclease subunit S n=1 Tax=Rhodococcus rhodochrous TaxID=1829 RepID=UPI00135209A2|nr:restriction endonuclease subunit S [Rhodococcus rhodochrous]